LWLHSLKVAQLLRSAACLHTNQSRSYLNHLVQSFYANAGVKLVVTAVQMAKDRNTIARLLPYGPVYH